MIRRNKTGHYKSGNPQCLQLAHIHNKMVARCFNPKRKDYDRYGGRGIVVCQSWKNFDNFREDMGYRPSAEYTLDRIENNLHYSCGKCDECIRNGWELNCKWSTQKEQARNRRNNLWIEYDGKKMIIQDWADLLDVSRDSIKRYLLRGKSFDFIYKKYSSITS